jgi:hypothetical protein
MSSCFRAGYLAGIVLVMTLCLVRVTVVMAGDPDDASLPPGTPGRALALPAASRASLEDHAARDFVFADPDWYQWGGSVIQGEDGKYHMFYSRWPRENPRGMWGWLYECQIARAVAEKPEGPYRHVEVILEGFGQPQAERWDAINAHNPCITRLHDPVTDRDRYYLYYIATRDDDNQFHADGRPDDWWDHIINQRVGVAVADSLKGPWVRHPEPVIQPPTGPFRHYLVNPGVCQLPDGRFLMVLKGRDDGPNHGRMIHGWALADRPEGPFVAQNSLLFPATMHAEDPTVWVQGQWIFVAVKDWTGHLSGQPGISYVRGKLIGDTIQWEVPENCNISPRTLVWDDGQTTPLANLERPWILRDKDGSPTHLFAACCVKNPFERPSNAPVGLHLPFNVCLPLGEP